MLSPAESAEVSLRIVREAPELSYDTETTGLDWRYNSPIGYVIGDADKEVVYVPVRHGGGGNLPDRNVKPIDDPKAPFIQHGYEKELAKAFEDRNRRGLLIVGHHLKFDAHMSANAGIMLGRNLSDTQNNEVLLDEYAKGFSLDACAMRHGVQAKKGQEMYDHLASLFGCAPDRKSMEHFWKTAGDDPVAAGYAAGDGVTTYQLYRKQLVHLEEQELLTVKALEDALIWTLFRMERRGIKVDTNYINFQLRQQVEGKIAAALAALPDAFNPRSSKMVRQLCEDAGRRDWPTTELGNPSFTEKFLKTFPEGKNVVGLRKWTNLLNTFVEPLLTEHTFEGRVHPSLNQLKSDDSGTPARLSCSKPNLQQIPKRDKEIARMFRAAFVADEGMEFWEADFSQAEPRTYAHYSQDPALIKGYSEPPFRDVHQLVADMMNVERDPTAKRMNMGIFTGMYPKTFAMHMEWPLDKATEMWNAWFDTFPGVRKFQEQATSVLRSRGYVKSMIGRRGRLESPRLAYKAVSKIIQFGNADILKDKILRLDKMCEAEGDQTHMLMTVHDSFEWQAPANEHGRKFSQAMMDEMINVQCEPWNFRVPFAVEADHGVNWCEATFGAPKVEEAA